MNSMLGRDKDSVSAAGHPGADPLCSDFPKDWQVFRYPVNIMTDLETSRQARTYLLQSAGDIGDVGDGPYRYEPRTEVRKILGILANDDSLDQAA